jgi:hypothetical protein
MFPQNIIDTAVRRLPNMFPDHTPRVLDRPSDQSLVEGQEQESNYQNHLDWQTDIFHKIRRLNDCQDLHIHFYDHTNNTWHRLNHRRPQCNDFCF